MIALMVDGIFCAPKPLIQCHSVPSPNFGSLEHMHQGSDFLGNPNILQKMEHTVFYNFLSSASIKFNSSFKCAPIMGYLGTNWQIVDVVHLCSS